MKFRSPITLLFSFASFQACKRSCEDQLVRYPFGSGPECGDPRFQTSVTCDQEKLTLTIHTGTYNIETVDYDNHVVYILDPSMTTCTTFPPSKVIVLDWDSPFTFTEGNFFALLGCSITSSPLYKSRNGDNGTVVPLCDNEGAPLCSLLYSCPAISNQNLPISSCCVYTPVDLGPAFDMDLQKLQCVSYAAVYSFNGQDLKPESWKYGVALKYKFSVKNDFPSACNICERSNGVCGYTGAYNLFICNCAGGVNTTTDCYFSASWNNCVKLLSWKPGFFIT
ncbi:hypothetical protein GIB67_004247 [Kingdonia uniflora]|uniref:Wall-associated receptor kinase galacturonan-binding domain-containing protein n=1 Tax=Kingdonia uniflora TaxID=39325 RepID=A0A7J7MQV9_9MAGN|nr:hypothetical protein GIB67_004247 [Kingdonia uniflora]